MNSLIVNFTIKYQERILSNHNFLNQFDLFGILSTQTETCDIPYGGKFRDMMYNYIEKRKNYCESQTLRGNILGTESEIPAPNEIDWITNQQEKQNPFLNRYSEKPLPKLKSQNVVMGKRRSAVVSPNQELYTWIDSVYSADLSNMSFANTAYHKEVKEMLVNDDIGIKSQMEKVEPSLIAESQIQPDDLPY